MARSCLYAAIHYQPPAIGRRPGPLPALAAWRSPLPVDNVSNDTVLGESLGLDEAPRPSPG
jgi:hypothetical protein